MRLMVRGYAEGRMVFEEPHELPDDGDREIDELTEESTLRLLAISPIIVLEVEFPDHPDPSQRFLRLGTDPASVVDVFVSL